MQMLNDMELVREYALRRSEEAFATLVSRHIDLAETKEPSLSMASATN